MDTKHLNKFQIVEYKYSFDNVGAKQSFYNGYIPMGKKEITLKPHTLLNLMASI